MTVLLDNQKTNACEHIAFQTKDKVAETRIKELTNYLRQTVRVKSELVYSYVTWTSVHVAIEECRHLANGCTTKCGCTGFILLHYLSYVWSQ